MGQLREITDYDDIRTSNYIDINEMGKEQFFPQYLSQRFLNAPITCPYSLYSYTESYISSKLLEKEVKDKKNEIIEFIEEQENIVLENKKDFINFLDDLSLEQRESLYNFLTSFVDFLKKNNRKAAIYVHDDQICIYIVFKNNESIDDIDAVIDKAYDLLKEETSIFVNIGEDFEE